MRAAQRLLRSCRGCGIQAACRFRARTAERSPNRVRQNIKPCLQRHRARAKQGPSAGFRNRGTLLGVPSKEILINFGKTPFFVNPYKQVGGNTRIARTAVLPDRSARSLRGPPLRGRRGRRGRPRWQRSGALIENNNFGTVICGNLGNCYSGFCFSPASLDSDSQASGGKKNENAPAENRLP